MRQVLTITRDELRKCMLDHVALRKAPSISPACGRAGEPLIVETVGNAQLSPRREADPTTPYP